jgi:hypothetical protein
MRYFEQDCLAPLLGKSNLLRVPKLSSLKLVEPQTYKMFTLGELPTRLTHNLKALDICGRLYVGRYHSIYQSTSFDRDQLLSIIWNSSQTLELLWAGVAPSRKELSNEHTHHDKLPVQAFPRLRVLSLNEMNSSLWRVGEVCTPHLQPIMTKMITPVLESLEFSPGRDEEADASSLIAFLETNRENLSQMKHLGINGYDNLRVRELETLLDIVGNGSVPLASLSLTGRGKDSFSQLSLQPGMTVLTSEILTRFNPGFDREVLFPHLRSFEWWGQMVEEFGPPDLCTFLLHRLAGSYGVTKLEDVEVGWYRQNDSLVQFANALQLGLGADATHGIQIKSIDHFQGYMFKVSTRDVGIKM